MSDMINRRTLLSGLVSALAAPAIVKAASIMPVRNGLIMIGRGSHSVTGITMAGKLIKEFVDPYEWTKTRWMKVFDVDGWHGLRCPLDLEWNAGQNLSTSNQGHGAASVARRPCILNGEGVEGGRRSRSVPAVLRAHCHKWPWTSSQITAGLDLHPQLVSFGSAVPFRQWPATLVLREKAGSCTALKALRPP